LSRRSRKGKRKRKWTLAELEHVELQLSARVGYFYLKEMESDHKMRTRCLRLAKKRKVGYHI